ncbi:MAG: sulfite exporter TauE/SafE family protein [Bacillota bacterium]
MNKKTDRIRVSDMHCQSCESRIEDTLGKLPGVSRVKADKGAGTVEVEYHPDITGLEEIESALSSLGYENGGKNKVWVYGLPFLFALIFILGSVYGNVDLDAMLNGKVTYLVIFIIGIVTSLHCAGMCGGLMLSQVISPGEGGRRAAAFSSLSYHTGRVVSYTIIGGAVGAIGGIISFSLPLKAGIMVLAGIFMILIGLNIGGFKIIGGRTLKFPLVNSPGGRRKSPFVVGLLNGFMPCGPLQTMQLYALGTGSAAAGAVSMLVFALGTMPLMLGFGVLASFLNRGYTRNILKLSGMLVIVLGLVMANRGLALVGVSLPGGDLLASRTVGESAVAKAEIQDGLQTVKMSANNQGYTPRMLVVQKGIPVRWVISGDQLNSCNNALVVPSLNIQKKLSPGENTIEFTPASTADISFSCWMGMIRGVIKVVDDLKTADLSGVKAPPSFGGGSCCSVDQGQARDSIYGSDLSKVPTDYLIKKAVINGQTQSASFEGIGYEFTPQYLLMNKDIPAKINFDLREFTDPVGRYQLFDYNTGEILGYFDVQGKSAVYEFTPQKAGIYVIVKNRSAFALIEVVDSLEKVDPEEVRKEMF